ncbi:carnitine dehydratase [Lewinellaceae bacterium SD302]|nr:carnitine dehydratase [Lewinellaceae bacterium SD302]
MSVLADLLIVELASVLAGPAVGQFFTELGARVIKIENATTGGDVTRNWKVSGEDPDKKDSAYFKSINHGKASRFLDFGDPTDREFAYELIRHADVVISNFPLRTAIKVGMEPERLLEMNPTLIFAQLDAFPPGNEDRPAYDIVLQAETGFLSMTGTTSGEICRMPVALIDILAAHQLKEGILLGLLKRERSGKGGLIRTNLYDSALASLANQATNYLVADKVAVPMGSQHPNIAPYGDIFVTSDGERIVLAVGSDRQFSDLCQLLGITDIPKKLRTNSARVTNRSELIDLLAPKLAAIELQQTLLLCQDKKVPVGHIKNMAQVFATAEAQRRLLIYPDGEKTVRTVAFEMEGEPITGEIQGHQARPEEDSMVENEREKF